MTNPQTEKAEGHLVADLSEIDAFDTGCEKERAAIVAWLRAEAQRHCSVCDFNAVVHFENAADAIERGEHLK